MFKIIYRIIIILLVAGLVSGGIYLFFNTSAGQALIQNGRGGFEREARFAPGGNDLISNVSGGAAFQPGPLDGFGGDGDFHGSGGSPLALIDLAKNAGIIGLITIGVVLVQKIWGTVRHQIVRRTLKPTAS